MGGLEYGHNNTFVGSNGFSLRVYVGNSSRITILVRTGPPTGFTRTRRRRDGFTPKVTGQVSRQVQSPYVYHHKL